MKTFIKKLWLAKLDLNAAFILAACGLCLCWLYGVPPLIGSYVSLKNLLFLKRNSQSDKAAIIFKIKWGLFMAWMGLIFSSFFTIMYLIAWITGAYVRL